MKATQTRTLQALCTAQRFLRDNAARFERAVPIHRAKLDEVLDDLSSLVATEQVRHLQAKELARRYAELRNALVRDHMVPISRIAFADLPVQRRVKALRMPLARPSAEHMAARAEAMARYASVFAKTFIDAGLSASFAEELRSAAEAMLAARHGRAVVMADRRGVVQTIASRLAEGRRIVSVADAFVRLALKDDPVLFSEWKKARRVRPLSKADELPQSRCM